MTTNKKKRKKKIISTLKHQEIVQKTQILHEAWNIREKIEKSHANTKGNGQKIDDDDRMSGISLNSIKFK